MPILATEVENAWRGLYLAVIAAGALLATVHFAVGSIDREKRWIEAVCAFIAFFFLLLGIRVTFGEENSNELLGCALASAGLTFFWMQWRKPA